MNIFDQISDFGDDGDFDPTPGEEPTGAVPGSSEKVKAMAARVRAGQELWHAGDRRDYEGLSGSAEKFHVTGQRR